MSDYSIQQRYQIAQAIYRIITAQPDPTKAADLFDSVVSIKALEQEVKTAIIFEGDPLTPEQVDDLTKMSTHLEQLWDRSPYPPAQFEDAEWDALFMHKDNKPTLEIVHYLRSHGLGVTDIEAFHRYRSLVVRALESGLLGSEDRKSV